MLLQLLKMALPLLEMVLLLLLKMVGNGATAAAKRGVALANDCAVAATKNVCQMPCCSS
jgi:hypothetical protein